MARGGESPGVPSRSSSSSYTKPQISKEVWGFFFSAPKKPAHAALSTERRVARRQRKGHREGGLLRLWARSVAALFAATGAGFVDAYAGQRRGHLGCNVTCGMMSRI